MTALATDRSTEKRDGKQYSYPVVATDIVYQGGLTVLDTAGNAEPGTTATGKKCVGRALDRADNATGAIGDVNVTVEAGVFRWANDDAITKVHIGDTAYIVDDQTVSKASAGKSAAGIIVDVDSLGVWVESSPEVALGSTGLVAANNLSDVGTAATAATNLGLGTGDSPTFTGGTFTGDLALQGGAGALTMTTAASSVVVLDNSATGLVLGSSGNTAMLTFNTLTGFEKLTVVGTTGKDALHVDVGDVQIDEDLNVTIDATVGGTLGVTGVTTPIGGVAAATAFDARPGGVCHTGGLPARVTTDGTNAALVATEYYVCEVFVPCNMTVTGISFFNGATAGTDSRHCALAYSDGSIVANTATGADVITGTDAYENVAFTGGAITVLGPATYFIVFIANGTTDKYNAHVIGNFRAGKITGETYQAITAFTPPTTFTTGLGPIASLY